MLGQFFGTSSSYVLVCSVLMEECMWWESGSAACEVLFMVFLVSQCWIVNLRHGVIMTIQAVFWTYLMDNCVPDSPTCKQLVQLGACGKMVWIQLHQFFECKERHLSILALLNCKPLSYSWLLLWMQLQWTARLFIAHEVGYYPLLVTSTIAAR